MNILYRGKPKPKYRWMERGWQCVRCSSVIEFEYEDKGLVKDYHDATDIRDDDWVKAECPICCSGQTFYETPEAKSIRKQQWKEPADADN